MKILAISDNHRWCWQTSLECLASAMPQHEIRIVSCQEFLRIPPDSIRNHDLIFGRGYSFHFHRPELDSGIRWGFCIPTGGTRFAERLSACIAHARTARFVLVQNRAAQKECSLRDVFNTTIVPNGIDCEHFAPAPKRPEMFTIGFAGNNFGSRADLKGTTSLGKIADECGFNFKECNSREKRLQYSEMPSFYRSLSAYVQPSVAEGCSNSVMEAMACGLPCLICRGVGYHGEVCEDGILSEDGQVVFVERSKTSISRALKILVENPYIYRRVSDNARRFAELHRWQAVARKYDAVFLSTMEDLCERRHNPGGPKAQHQPLTDTPQAPQAQPPQDDGARVYTVVRPFKLPTGRSFNKDQRVILPAELAEKYKDHIERT